MRDTKTKIGMRGSKGSEKCQVVAVELQQQKQSPSSLGGIDSTTEN